MRASLARASFAHMRIGRMGVSWRCGDADRLAADGDRDVDLFLFNRHRDCAPPLRFLGNGEGRQGRGEICYRLWRVPKYHPFAWAHAQFLSADHISAEDLALFVIQREEICTVES